VNCWKGLHRRPSGRLIFGAGLGGSRKRTHPGDAACVGRKELTCMLWIKPLLEAFPFVFASGSWLGMLLCRHAPIISGNAPWDLHFPKNCRSQSLIRARRHGRHILYRILQPFLFGGGVVQQAGIRMMDQAAHSTIGSGSIPNSKWYSKSQV
jgi:hypothetical protein